MKDKYIVYKTINKVNNREYIGVHKQKGSDFDGYLGSGNLISRAIDKHGKENFVRETLFSYDNSQEAYSKERELVTEDYVSKDSTYNLAVGGLGGVFYMQSDDVIDKRNKTMTERYGYPGGNMHTKEAKKNSIETRRKLYGTEYSMLHTKEVRQKVKKSIENKYGKPYGQLRTEEAQKKKGKAKSEYNRKKSLEKYPELKINCILLDPDDNIVKKGTVYEISLFMHGKIYAVGERHKVLNKLKLGERIKRGNWKGYRFINY